MTGSVLAVTVPRSRVPLRVTLLFAFLWGAVTAVATVVAVLDDLTAQDVGVSTPVAQFYPKVNPTLKLDGATATLTGGGYDHATFSISGLHWDARLLLACGVLLQGATAVLIAAALVVLCSRVAAGRPFAPAVARAIKLSGITVLLGGLLWQVCFQWGQYLALRQAFQITSGEWMNNVAGITPTSVSWPHVAGGYTIDFWPIGIGLALFALAAVFRYGAGVELERTTLRRETEGLV